MYEFIHVHVHQFTNQGQGARFFVTSIEEWNVHVIVTNTKLLYTDLTVYTVQRGGNDNDLQYQFMQLNDIGVGAESLHGLDFP